MLIGHGAVLGHSFTVGRWRRPPGTPRSTSGPRSTRSSARRSSTSTRTRARPSAASTASSRGSSARSPTSAWRSATGWPATWPRRATSRSSTTRSWPGSSRRTTWRPIGSRPEGAERDEIAAKARTTLLDAAARSRDLHAYAGAQRFLEQALAFAADPADEREILTRLAGCGIRRSRRSWPSSTGPRGSRAARSRRRAPAATRPRPPGRTRRWRASSPRTTTPRRPATSCARPWTSSRAGPPTPTWCGWRPSSGAPT